MARKFQHGSISLIIDGTRVIGICTEDSIASKTISNIKEVKGCNAYVLFITNKDVDDNFYDKKIILPKVHDLVAPIISVIPLQLIAYEVAKLRG